MSKVCNVCNLKAIDNLHSFRNQVGLSTLHILGTIRRLISCINIIVGLVSCLKCRGLHKYTYTKIMSNKFTVLSVNVRRLRNYKKRRKVFNWLVKKAGSHSVCFLQEANCDIHCEQNWRNQWRGFVFFSHGKTDSRGVMILIGSGLEFSQLKISTDESGRYITLLCEIQGCKYLLVNSYAPNTENEQVPYFQKVHRIINSLKIYSHISIATIKWRTSFDRFVSLNKVDY